jgi:hypothetical protein
MFPCEFNVRIICIEVSEEFVVFFFAPDKNTEYIFINKILIGLVHPS